MSQWKMKMTLQKLIMGDESRNMQKNLNKIQKLESIASDENNLYQTKNRRKQSDYYQQSDQLQNVDEFIQKSMFKVKDGKSVENSYDTQLLQGFEGSDQIMSDDSVNDCRKQGTMIENDCKSFAISELNGRKTNCNFGRRYVTTTGKIIFPGNLKK